MILPYEDEHDSGTNYYIQAKQCFSKCSTVKIANNLIYVNFERNPKLKMVYA